MSNPLEIGGSVWARYAEGTRGRDPMKFLGPALKLTDGHDGSGRLAIDLGCGAGNETLALLERGWHVHAVDGEPRAIEILESRVLPETRPRLTTEVAKLHEADLPEADLVFASLSIPFAGDNHDESVGKALSAVKPGGWFVGVFFGEDDSWASEPDIAWTDLTQIAALFADFGRYALTKRNSTDRQVSVRSTGTGTSCRPEDLSSRPRCRGESTLEALVYLLLDKLRSSSFPSEVQSTHDLEGGKEHEAFHDPPRSPLR